MPDESPISRRTVTVSRTAHYCLAGPPTASQHWFVLHGYGQRAADFIQPCLTLQTDDRCVVAPEALSTFYTDGMHEHQTVGASWMTRANRETEIADYVAYLDILSSTLETPAQARAPNRCVLGFSQGAATASRWALLGETTIHRLILWAGDLAHDLDLDAHTATLQSMDLDLVVGTDDPYISDDRVRTLRQRLDAHDISYRVHRFDGGHHLNQAVLRSLGSRP